MDQQLRSSRPSRYRSRMRIETNMFKIYQRVHRLSRQLVLKPLVTVMRRKLPAPDFSSAP